MKKSRVMENLLISCRRCCWLLHHLSMAKKQVSKDSQDLCSAKVSAPPLGRGAEASILYERLFLPDTPGSRKENVPAIGQGFLGYSLKEGRIGRARLPTWLRSPSQLLPTRSPLRIPTIVRGSNLSPAERPAGSASCTACRKPRNDPPTPKGRMAGKGGGRGTRQAKKNGSVTLLAHGGDHLGSKTGFHKPPNPRTPL